MSSEIAESDKLLAQWDQVQKQLAEIKELELTLRKQVFDVFFSRPLEGVNNFDLGNGYKLKGTFKINRTLDEAMLHAKADELTKAGINLRDVIQMKPSLVTKSYRALETDKRMLFEQVLDIKVGTPALEIVAPKEKE